MRIISPPENRLVVLIRKIEIFLHQNSISNQRSIHDEGLHLFGKNHIQLNAIKFQEQAGVRILTNDLVNKLPRFYFSLRRQTINLSVPTNNLCLAKCRQKKKNTKKYDFFHCLNYVKLHKFSQYFSINTSWHFSIYFSVCQASPRYIQTFSATPVFS